MSETDETLAILRRHLDADFIVHPMAEHATPLEEVSAVAERLGVRFPEEVEAHLTGKFPGLLVEVKQAIWPRLEAYDVAPLWKHMNGVQTYTASSASEGWMRIEVTARRLYDKTGLHAAPVLRVVGDPDIVCVTPGGELAKLDRDANVLLPVERGFFEIYEEALRALVERKHRYKAEAS